jgi:hypothetical protein
MPQLSYIIVLLLLIIHAIACSFVIFILLPLVCASTAAPTHRYHRLVPFVITVSPIIFIHNCILIIAVYLCCCPRRNRQMPIELEQKPPSSIINDYDWRQHQFDDEQNLMHIDDRQ